MCLQSPWHVVEDALIADLAGSQFPHARDVLHSVGHLVPYSEEFISSRILWRLDWVVVNDERVEFDHFLVILQERDGQLTRNVGRKGCNCGE